MQRRELLKTAGFAATLSLPGDPTTAAPNQSKFNTGPPSRAVSGPEQTDRWFLNWLPRSLAHSEAGYSFGATPAGFNSDDYDQRHVRLLTDHAMLTVSIGADLAEVRKTVRTDGYEQLPSKTSEIYGRSIGNRYRLIRLDDDTTIEGVGPAPGPIRNRMQAITHGDGTNDPDHVLTELFDHLLPADHLSVDVRPAPGIAGIGEHATVGDTRSRLRTVVLTPTGNVGPRAKSYLGDIDGIDGVHATSVTQSGPALIRDATVQSGVLRDQLEASHGY